MAFQNNAELVNQAVRAIANTGPHDWTKIIFYMEFLDDENIGLRNKSTGRCFGGSDFGARLDDYSVGGSMEAFNSLKALYHDAAKNGDRWTGVLLTIFSDGQFKCRFHYGEGPLLNNDRAAVQMIISEGMGYAPRTANGLESEA